MSDNQKNQENQTNQPYNIPYFNPYFPYFPMGSMGPYPGYGLPHGYPFMPHPPLRTQQLPHPAIKTSTQIKSQANIVPQAPQINALSVSSSLSHQSASSQSCHCVKSHCLKQYCLCFKKGNACQDKCSCSGCKNTEDDLNQKLKPKSYKKIKCKCHKSQCIKKYCQCYSANRKCQQNCLCIGCQN